ncbi:MAG: hypothetical protein AAB732_01025 [Patescibacteria group bacterium]
MKKAQKKEEKKMARGKKRIAIIVLFVTTGLAFAGTGGYYFYNNNPVMAKKSPVVVATNVNYNEEEPTVSVNKIPNPTLNLLVYGIDPDSNRFGFFLVTENGDQKKIIQWNTISIEMPFGGPRNFFQKKITLDPEKQYQIVFLINDGSIFKSPFFSLSLGEKKEIEINQGIIMSSWSNNS